MLLKLFNALSSSGIDKQLDPSSARYIILTNRFGIICGLISFAILILDFFAHDMRGWTSTSYLIVLATLLFFSILSINRYGFHTLAKWLMSWFPPIFIICISIFDKKFNPEDVSINDFFLYRFLVMTTLIIPVLVFETKKLGILLFNLIPGFLVLVFFEVIHKPFGVSFTQFGYNDPHFYVLDLVVALAYFGVVGFLLNQRIITDKFELKLYSQQKKLLDRNQELNHKNSFINEQNHEITTQSDSLKEANDALMDAQRTIELQKQLLEDQNKTLEVQVLEKTKDLSRVNEELIINNNELRQFSHTLSHNLKSPVATFQGLLNLIEENDLNDANKELLKYLYDSVNLMQMVFADLNEMLELRNQLYISREIVDVQKEIDTLHNQFYYELRRNGINFSCACNDVKAINTNEKRLSGILFQLISNSIKYRASDRVPEIKISINGNDEYHSIKVRDNGIGIDMDKYQNKLFYPYQRFDDKTTGKGLGLYLVKLQTESLGGKVNISSVLNSYTEVEILLKK